SRRQPRDRSGRDRRPGRPRPGRLQRAPAAGDGGPRRRPAEDRVGHRRRLLRAVVAGHARLDFRARRRRAASPVRARLHAGQTRRQAARPHGAPVGFDVDRARPQALPCVEMTARLIEIIEWTDAGRDTLSYRFPDEDHLIMRGAQLIVRESQTAQFMYLGQFADTFGPGRHRLVTANIPILNHLKGWKYGFESPFKADVYFVATRTFAGNEWGTSNPVMLHDAELGIVRVRAFGTYDFHIADARRFLREVAGTDNEYALAQFSGAMRSRIVSAFSDALAASNIPVLGVASRYREIGQALLPLVNATLHDKYGIEMTSLIVEHVSAP